MPILSAILDEFNANQIFSNLMEVIFVDRFLPDNTSSFISIALREF
nr:MAG TPA_asm: hypothetical protein [Caudoviricetes sp.]